MKSEKVEQVDMVEMLLQKYQKACLLPLTPQTGIRKAKILAQLAMLGRPIATLNGQESKKGAPAATGRSFCTSQGCTGDSLPF